MDDGDGRRQRPELGADCGPKFVPNWVAKCVAKRGESIKWRSNSRSQRWASPGIACFQRAFGVWERLYSLSSPTHWPSRSPSHVSRSSFNTAAKSPSFLFNDPHEFARHFQSHHHHHRPLSLSESLLSRALSLPTTLVSPTNIHIIHCPLSPITVIIVPYPRIASAFLRSDTLISPLFIHSHQHTLCRNGFLESSRPRRWWRRQDSTRRTGPFSSSHLHSFDSSHLHIPPSSVYPQLLCRYVPSLIHSILDSHPFFSWQKFVPFLLFPFSHPHHSTPSDIWSHNRRCLPQTTSSRQSHVFRRSHRYRRSR